MVTRRIGVLTVVVGVLVLVGYGVSAGCAGRPVSFDLVAQIGSLTLLVLALCVCTCCFAILGTAEGQEWSDVVEPFLFAAGAITLMVIPGILLMLLLGAGHVCLSTGSCGHGGRSGGIGRCAACGVL